MIVPGGVAVAPMAAGTVAVGPLGTEGGARGGEGERGEGEREGEGGERENIQVMYIIHRRVIYIV